MEEIDKLTTQDARRKARFLYLASCVPLFALVAFAVWFALPSTAQQLVYITGEEGRFQQLRGLWNLALDRPAHPCNWHEMHRLLICPPISSGRTRFCSKKSRSASANAVCKCCAMQALVDSPAFHLERHRDSCQRRL